MPFAGNELGNAYHHEIARIQIKGIEKLFPTPARSTFGLIDGTVHHPHPLGRRTIVNELPADSIRNRNDRIVKTVLHGADQRHFPIVDAPAKNGREIFPASGKSAPEIAATPTVHMKEVRPCISEPDSETSGEAQIQVTFYRHGNHVGRRRIGRRRNSTARRTNQRSTDSPGRQALQQHEHLTGAAIKMPAGFKVNDMHHRRLAAFLGQPGLWPCPFDFNNKTTRKKPASNRQRKPVLHAHPSFLIVHDQAFFLLPCGRPQK